MGKQPGHRPLGYGVQLLAERARMRALGHHFEGEAVDFAAARVRLRRINDDDEEAARGWRIWASLIDRDRKSLRRVEEQLAGGVYLRGPRKGQPLDDEDRARKKSWAGWLHRRLVEDYGTSPEPAA